MLFSVTDPDLANTSSGGHVTDLGGDDIIFVAHDASTCGGSASCALDHEIEKYVSTTGELVVWVRIPSVNTALAASDTVIYVYYGDSTVTSPTENPNGVWDANFQAVWHLEEQVTDEATGGSHDDSTSNANHGTQTANGPFTGVIADAQDFDGTGDFITVADHDSLSFAPNSPFSVSAWIFTDTTTRNVIVGREGPSTGPSEWDFYIRSSGQLALIAMDGRFSNRIGLQTAANFPTGGWHHVSGTYDGSGTSAGMSLYVDGVQPATADYSRGTYVAMDNATMPLWIGAYNGGGNNYDMDGRIDEVRLSNTVRSACWVDAEYDNQFDPGDIGVPGFYTVGIEATAVELLSFEARGLDGSVELEWETGSELDNLGFHLYRSMSSTGPYERVTASLIPGLGSSPEGARYRYVDGGLENGQTYYYELEDVETTGRTERHGPVSATPAAGAVVDDGVEALEEEGSESVITYGEPEANGLRVVHRGQNKVVLELRTEGFVAYPEPDGTVRIEIADYLGVDEQGLPTKTTWVEAVAGRRVELLSVREHGVETVGLRPRETSEDEVVGSGDGVVELRKRGGRSVKRGSVSDAARLVSVGFQGEVKKALVEMSPLSWDASRQELRLAKKLVVTLSFAKRDGDERAGRDGRRGRRSRVKDPPRSQGVMARLATRAPGLYAVRYEELFGKGNRRGVEAGQLRLSRLGETAAFHLEPSASRFGPGSTLYFVSPGAEANPYGDEAVFELAYGVSDGVAMPVRDASPSGAVTSVYSRRDAYEENHLYQATLRESEPRWLWELLFAPERKGYPFSVNALASGGEPSRLELWLQGGTDFPASPDHHVAVYVNGTRVAERSWNGKLAQTFDVELWPGVLREGENLLEVENVGDTGALYSMVYMDRYAVTYPRLARAEDGWLEGEWMASGTAEVSGMSSSVSLVDTTGAQPMWLAGAASSSDGVVRFRSEAERRYLAVDAHRVQSPEVRQASAPGWTSGSHQADYLVLGPRVFLDAAKPLLDHRRRQGLTTVAVPVEDVYDELGYGESRPEALRDFLAYAYHHWKAPSPRYVLLLGDATYDFKDYYGTGVANRVPPLILHTSYLWTVSDPTYAAVNGDDLLPDLAIGRLPAANVDEVRTMVGKILAYETGEATLGGPVVLVSDDPDVAGDFPADAEALAATVLAGRTTKHISLQELGAEATRRAVREAFDGGASVLSYIGHGGIHVWANENLLDVTSVASLSAQPQQPLLLTMNCLNGYFHFPFFNSLSEELVKAEGKGAIAAFSPSGMSLNGPAHLYHQALLNELLHGSHRRLGDAVLAAQEAYAETGALPELLSIYHLLGDPALTLRGGSQP
jgi:hypothetical protein